MKRVVVDTFPLCITPLRAHNWVAVGGTDGTLKLKNVQNLREENVRSHSAGIQTIAAASDGRFVVTGGKGELVKWDASELDN